MATMNEVERKFHNLIKLNLTNLREDSPSKTYDGYAPSSRFSSLKDAKDKKNFKKLYNVKPKATYGNGEVALFWLWNYHESNLDENDEPTELFCRAGASGNQPDLKYKKTNIEIKSYPAGKTKDIKTNIGRFQGKEDFVYFVNQIFSIRNALVGGIKVNGEPARSVSTLLFGYKELAEAAEQFCILRSALHMMEKEGKLPEVFKSMKETTDAWDTKANSQGLKSCTKDRAGGQHIATELIRYGIKVIMGDKPGDGGYILNVVGSKTQFANKFKWHQIKLDKMTTNESVLALGSGKTKVMDTLPAGSDYKDTQTFGFNGATFSANLFRLFPEGT